MKILLVDDDPRLRELVALTLERAGHAVVAAADGQQALDRAARERPDLVVLDVGLPRLDGFEVCRRLRGRGDAVPILFLTARDDEIDRIVGLELGADDYVTKPFSPRELAARVAAILKRSAPAEARILARGALRLEPERHVCAVAGAPVALTGSEMAILAHLAARPDRVHARPALADAVFGAGAVSDRTLDSHLRNLRAKLAAAGCADAVETVHGVGLRMGDCTA